MDVTGPIFMVSVLDAAGNQELLRPEDVRITQLIYTDSERAADKCVLTVDNFDLSHFDNPVWKQGNRVRVSWGYPGRITPARICVIRKVTGFTSLKVEANGLEVVMNRVTRSRTFENMTVSEIVTQIARENGYGEDAIDIQDTQERRDHTVQANLTDHQFMRRLAHQHNFEFFLDWDGFHFHERRLDQRSAKTITWYSAQVQSEIESINIKNDVTALPGRVRVRRRDPIERTDIVSSSDNNTDTNRPSTGPSIVVADQNTATLTGQILVAQEQQTQGISSTTATSAETESQSRFRRAQQRAVQMNMTIVGDPFLLAKSIVNLDGLGKRLSGPYYVKEAKHTVDGTYKTALSLIKDATGEYQRRAARDDGLPNVASARVQGNQSEENEEAGTSQNNSSTNTSGSNVRYIRAVSENATLTDTTFIPGGTAENRGRPVRRFGRDSRTRGGQPTPPASTNAAQQNTRD